MQINYYESIKQHETEFLQIFLSKTIKKYLLVHFLTEGWFIWLVVLFFNIFGDDFQGWSKTAFHCTKAVL